MVRPSLIAPPSRRVIRKTCRSPGRRVTRASSTTQPGCLEAERRGEAVGEHAHVAQDRPGGDRDVQFAAGDGEVDPAFGAGGRQLTLGAVAPGGPHAVDVDDEQLGVRVRGPADTGVDGQVDELTGRAARARGVPVRVPGRPTRSAG